MLLQRATEPEQVKKLLETGKTDLLHRFISKKGRPFSAFLVRGADGKVGFEFAPRAVKPDKAAATPATAKASGFLCSWWPPAYPRRRRRQTPDGDSTAGNTSGVSRCRQQRGGIPLPPDRRRAEAVRKARHRRPRPDAAETRCRHTALPGAADIGPSAR